jgi:type IV pilus assembly protein PilV
MRPTSSKSGQGGVLLIEAMISLLIFSFAFLGLVGMQAKAIQISVESEDRNAAALLANEIISTMWAQQTADASVLSSEISAWKTRVKNALPPYDDTVTATVGAADSDKVVTVTIGWTPNGKTANGTATTHKYVTQVSMP